MEFKGTPGPWRWELNERSKDIALYGGIPTYDLTVMDFVRWGMQGARPRFRTGGNLMIMEPVTSFGAQVKGREHHSEWFKSVKHPDALLISDAPDLLKQLYNLAILSIQSDRYNEDVDFKIAVDKSFSLIKKHAKI